MTFGGKVKPQGTEFPCISKAKLGDIDRLLSRSLMRRNYFFFDFRGCLPKFTDV